jgi:hypothetical protein
MAICHAGEDALAFLREDYVAPIITGEGEPEPIVEVVVGWIPWCWWRVWPDFRDWCLWPVVVACVLWLAGCL